MQTLKDILSHLSFVQSCKLLGEHGKELIMAGGKYEIDLFEQVTLDPSDSAYPWTGAVVEIVPDPSKPRRLDIRCSACNAACVHKGAALSVILEEKLALGLSAPPPERVPIESLSEEALIRQALSEREERARSEKMLLKSMDPGNLWSDYILTSRVSGKSYRVALRGFKPGESYCSCPDFRKNTLGTCKHILYALEKVKKKFPKSVQKIPAKVEEICLYLKYGSALELRLLLPEKLSLEIKKHLSPFRDAAIEDVKGLLHCIASVESMGAAVNIYPDAEEYVKQKLFELRMEALVSEIRRDPEAHPLRKSLLKTELLPYQLDGIAFAAGIGRAVLADDMGLGKTIQGIGVAEFLSRHAAVSKVLVICPASLKSQWYAEIKRFSSRRCRTVLGSAKDRPAQYAEDAFFTVCNYEQVLRDILSIEKVSWDLIILDEGQRIKNWEARTSRVLKALKSLLPEKTEDGRLQMTFTLPDESFLDTMARSLAQMVGRVS